MSDTVVVGTCRCGGYGFCYDEETEEKTGKCHETAEELNRKCRGLMQEAMRKEER